MLLTLISVICFNSVTVSTRAAQPIVERTQYYVGDTFNITCDITKFSGQLPTSHYISTMSLMRQTLIETKFSTIAIYQPFLSPSEQNITTLPFGRQWIVQYSGGDGYTNRQTMKIVTTVVGLRCDDAGLYKCAVTFPGSLTPIDSNVANLTVKDLIAQFSQDDMSVTPRNGEDPYSSSYELGENENINIEMTCNFKGPGNLQAVWKHSKDSNEQNYPYLNEIVDETPVTTTSAGCTSSSYRSTLKIQLQEDHDGTTYYCIIVDSNVEMSRANFTIGVSSTICPAGLWGSYCKYTCDKKCYGSICSKLSGECYEGCLGYDDPPNCYLRCRSGFYGKDCSSSCSADCVDSLCHYVNGQCLSIYNGDFLFDGKSFGIGVGVTVAVASICMISLIIYHKLKRPKTKIKHNAYNVPDPQSIDNFEYEQANKTGERNQSYYNTDPQKTLQMKNVNGQTNPVYDTID